jgi:hypothetical protein
VQRNPLITFEPIGGFGWNLVWRWWHCILFTVSLCRASGHITSSQNFLFHVRVTPISAQSVYGLEDRAIGVRSPAETKRTFPLASVSRSALGPSQPRVEWVSGVLSPGVKRGLGVTLTTRSHLMPRSRMRRSQISSLPMRLHGA